MNPDVILSMKTLLNLISNTSWCYPGLSESHLRAWAVFSSKWFFKTRRDISQILYLDLSSQRMLPFFQPKFVIRARPCPHFYDCEQLEQAPLNLFNRGEKSKLHFAYFCATTLVESCEFVVAFINNSATFELGWTSLRMSTIRHVRAICR